MQWWEMLRISPDVLSGIIKVLGNQELLQLTLCCIITPEIVKAVIGTCLNITFLTFETINQDLVICSDCL